MTEKKEATNPGRTGRKWGIALVALAGLAFAAIAWWPPGLESGPDRANPAAAALGQTLFKTQCAACHGEGGAGEISGQPMGGRKPGGLYIAPALNGTGHAWHHPPDMLFRIVKFGSPAKGSTMAGWEGRMSDPEIWAVLDYLFSLWPEPLRLRLQQARGG
ncbi:MAG: c-type cytochrome [bacterium]